MNRELAVCAVGLLFCLIATGCSGAMANQPKVEPLEVNAFFPDAQSARPMPPNTVARSAMGSKARYATMLDPVFASRRKNGELVATIPISLTEALLARGQEQYNVYCVPYHGIAGYGDGAVVQRSAALVPQRVAATGSSRIPFRRHRQRLWQHVCVWRARDARRSLGHRGLRACLAVERARSGSLLVARRFRPVRRG